MKRIMLEEQFRELFITTENQYINLFGQEYIGKSYFLESLKKEWLFPTKKTLWLQKTKNQSWDDLIIENNEVEILIFQSEEIIDFFKFRSFIESKMINWKIIFTTDLPIIETWVSNFEITGVYFREFCEYSGLEITVKELMIGNIDIKKGNILLGQYIQSWYFPSHLDNPDCIFSDFEEKCTIMKQELYKKEHNEFIEFLRTLAMNTWNLFKADQLAKILWISRRKIHKYMEILLKYNSITAIWPWSENTITETTRHVKVYFTDLSFLHALLGDLHFQGAMKEWAIQNFIFLELREKLWKTHDLFFYRKKSWAEIAFLLIHKESLMITPIEVHVRETDVISQILRSFDESYHDRVDYYMISNESRYGKKQLNEKPLIIIPHFAI